ncbi:MAG: hypothetical protein IPM69_16250 [Ignavibacteria bacterium]|nr:hypothetical protein [Ignavibacteria bacterium]
MKLVTILIISFLCAHLMMFSSVQENTKPKKIVVIESNNVRLDDKENTIPFRVDINDSSVYKLRDYIKSQISISTESDPQIIFSLMEWVRNQWQHDGFSEPPPDATSLEILQLASKGAKFSCNEYGAVFSDVLLSMGYISRIVNLNSIDIAYGPLGMGHVASEVWSNTMQKWMFIDPQFCISAQHKGQYLSYYDIYQLRKQGKYNDIEFMVPSSHLKKINQTKAAVVSEYRKFIQNYFGYLVTPYRRSNFSSLIVLMLDAKEQFLTNQGLSSHPLVFTHDPKDFYFPINRTLVVFNYQAFSPSWSQIVSEYQLQTMDDYKKNMYKFAAKPDFTLLFQNNMPWFDHYEFKNENGEWIPLQNDLVNWVAKDGLNTIHARAVNVMGVCGPATTVKIRYE